MNLIASVSLLVLLIGLSHGQTTVSPCTIEFNADYLYNDIRNEYVASTGACQDLCNAYPTCQSWSFVIGTNACWLKSANRANRVDSQGRISGGKCPTSSGATTTASGLTPPLTTTAAISPPTTTVSGLTPPLTTTAAISPPTTTIGQSTTTKPSTTTAGITPPTTGATTTTATTTATTATTSKATTTTATSTTTTIATSTTTTATTASTATTTLASTTAASTTAASTTSASTTSASTTSSSKKCFLEVSIAYKIATLGSSSATSKDDCCAQCIAKTNCKAWTFYTDTNLCVFLDYVPMYASQREQNGKAVSGVIQ